MDLANIYAIQKDSIPKAFEYHDKSINLFEKIKDSSGLAKAHLNTIHTAMQAKDYNMAYVHLIKAKKFTKFGDRVFVICLDNLAAEYHMAKGNYEIADRYFVKVIRESKKRNLSLELEKAYGNYSKSLFNQGKYKKAFEAKERYEEYFTQNLVKRTSAESEALSAEFQVEEYRKDVREAEIKNQLQAEIVENKSKLNTFLLVVAAFILVLFIGLIFAYQNRKELVNELKVRNKEALKAKEESEKLAKAKSKFFSTVSHELRTPLYGVIGLSTILLEDKTLVKHEKDLKSLKFSADYLLALINDVLQINKIDSNSVENEQSSFDIRELIRKISSSFEYMRLQNKNRIHIHISESIPKYIGGNSVRLSQILMNLLGNACKFTEDGDIYLIAESSGITESSATVKFYLKDTGIGIPKDKQESIFEEFSQANSINYNYQGTGLGLPIVKKLLALSGSEIHLESEIGKGSLFSFTLSFDVIEQVEEKKETAILDTALLDGKRILIVEDNRINQTVTKKILEKNNMLCAIAENGEQAINMVRKEIFDLILMDINMPVKNGMQATKEIREFNKTIPIVALTAVEVEEMRHKIYDSGMNDIIVKPYDVTKFSQTILRNITKTEAPSKPIKNARLRAV
jgi:signal transduction histidine kinase/CheY-like chemotaxis protein